MLYTQHILFLVYRHASVFLVDYIEHFFSVWVSFESAWINCLFFIYISASHHYAVLSPSKRMIPFYFPSWTLMSKNVFFFFSFSNAVANIFFRNDGFIVTLIVRCAMQCLLWLYIFLNGCPVRTLRLELQWIFLDEVTVEAMPFLWL